MPAARRRGFLGRFVDRLGKSSVELEADELHDSSVRMGDRVGLLIEGACAHLFSADGTCHHADSSAS